MKSAALSLAALAAASMMAVGCANNNKKAAAPGAVNPSVTDVRPVVAPAAPPVIVQPVQPVQPVVSDTPPVVQAAPAPAPAPAAAPAATGGTYTVQKGDTLYKIARDKYGQASAVKKILAANPGLNGGNLKAGQKINLP